MQEQEPVTITTDAMALAEAQAADDAALLAALNEKKRLVAKLVLDEVEAAEEKHAQPVPVRIPLNRAQRRAQVKTYARLLAETERQTPVVNPTIIARSKRRKRPGQHGRLQHAH